jgi:2-polyprenyl-3-methyl-5-hydroxy-6-metoxy-1,4-benzoquinol methylase
MIDVGCARGLLGREMKASGWRVVGVELDEEDAQFAEEVLDQVLVGRFDAVVGRLPKHVEAVVFADVLEHMVNPSAALADAFTILERGGSLLVSIPNVAHASARWDLLRGRFQYTDRGIFDRTHLRFFTRETAMQLVSDAGFTIERIWSTPAPIELVWPHLVSSTLGRAVLRVNDSLPKLWPRMFAYQTLISAIRP